MNGAAIAAITMMREQHGAERAGEYAHARRFQWTPVAELDAAASPAAPIDGVRAGIDRGEREIADGRPDREKQRGRGGAADGERDITRAERIEHQAAEARPCGDELDGERSAEQLSRREAVDREHRPERGPPDLTPDHA